MSLSLRGLRVAYPGTTAVDDVDLDLERGEVVALLGPSGSGKSSLLRAVAGLEEVAAGTITWDGRDVVGVPVHRRGFGLMFQDGQLFPFRDVGGNVAYGLAGTPRARRAEIVARTLALVGLPGFERRAVTTLSGGQAQRVALARALAPGPRLLLLDEPLSALDRALREQLAVDVREILRRQGTTALYVTHDQDEAMTVADRVGVMDAGRLLRLDVPERLWADPRSVSVARFLGFGPLLSREETALLGWGGAWEGPGQRAAGRPARAGGADGDRGPGQRAAGRPARAGGADGDRGVGRSGSRALDGAAHSSRGPGALGGDYLAALAPGALTAVVPGDTPDLPRARVQALRTRRGERLADVDLLGHPATARLEPGVGVEPGDDVVLLLDARRTALVRADT